MAINFNIDQSITLEEASEFTKNYRDKEGAGATLAGAFGKEIVTKILNQSTCVGLRIYYALNDDGKKTFVLAGVNSEGDDLYQGQLAEYSLDCPPNCPKKSPLAGNA